jgi:hypothetical protein
MAGKRDALEPPGKSDCGVFLGLTEGVFAQRGVTVGFVKQRHRHLTRILHSFHDHAILGIFQ